MALSLGFFKGSVEEDPESDMVTEDGGGFLSRWGDELVDLERTDKYVKGHMRSWGISGG